MILAMVYHLLFWVSFSLQLVLIDHSAHDAVEGEVEHVWRLCGVVGGLLLPSSVQLDNCYVYLK